MDIFDYALIAIQELLPALITISVIIAAIGLLHRGLRRRWRSKERIARSGPGKDLTCVFF